MKKYPKYKPSGVEWIGDIPEHWELSRLKNFIEKEINGVWGEEAKGDDNDKICIRVADFDREFNNLIKSNNTISNICQNSFPIYL
jgi:type I restriction enzyme S subunit